MSADPKPLPATWRAALLVRLGADPADVDPPDPDGMFDRWRKRRKPSPSP